jgi:transketolase
VVTAEAGIAMGWEAIASTREDILSIDRFGESGPGDEVAKDLGLTPERLALMIRG